MTERAPRRQSTPEAAGNGSRVSAVASGAADAIRRAGGVGAVVLLLGLAAAVLMVVTELSTYRSVQVITASCEDLASQQLKEDCHTTGGEQHNWALLPIALVTLLMAWGAGPGRSRPAAGALVFLGLLTLGIALIGDLPHTDVTGAVGRNLDQAEGQAGPAIALEIVAAVLALAAGGLRLGEQRLGLAVERLQLAERLRLAERLKLAGERLRRSGRVKLPDRLRPSRRRPEPAEKAPPSKPVRGEAGGDRTTDDPKPSGRPRRPPAAGDRPPHDRG